MVQGLSWFDIFAIISLFLPSFSTYLSHDERLFYPLTLIPTHLSLAIVFKDWVDLTFCYGCIILVFIWVSTVVCLATVIGQWLLWRVKAFCDTCPRLSWLFTAWSLVNSDHHPASGGFMQGYHYWMIKIGWVMSLYQSSFMIHVKGDLQISKPVSWWQNSGIQCDDSSKDPSSPHPSSIVAFKKIISNLTMLRDRSVGINVKG